ncbi:MAG: hypothetical protein JSU59_00970, partial [Nitrospirota bacterium]
MKKIAFIILIAANFGLPLNSWGSFIVLLLGMSIVLVGRVSADRQLWQWSGLITFLAITMRLVLPSHEINEGHAVFDPDANSALSRALPKDVYEAMRQDYVALDNWFEIRSSPKAWGVSMDAIWERSSLSRWREELTFKDRWDLRVGALNDRRHDYYRFGLPSTEAYIPLVFRFDLPASTAGGRVCWQGSVYWPVVDDAYEKIMHDRVDCRDLPDIFSTIPLTLYAADFDPTHPLAMRMERTGVYDYAPFLKQLFGLVGASVTLLLLGRIRFSALIAVAGTVWTLFVVFTKRGPPFGFTSMSYMPRGTDGLTHYGWGREVLTGILYGQWEYALRGSEDIFFFMPGMRYVWPPLMVLFGETFFGYWLLVSLMPFLTILLARHLFRQEWLVIFLALFIFIPVFKGSGFFQYNYSFLAVYGIGGAMAWTAFLAALVIIYPVFDNSKQPSTGALFIAGVFFAISLACRPNLVPGVMIIVVAAMMVLALNSNWRWTGIFKAGALGCGAAMVFLLTYHNWYFGDRFVLLTSSADHHTNLVVPPGYYVDVLKAVYSGDADGKLEKIITNFLLWIDYGWPWRQFAYINLWVALFWRQTPLAIRTIALSLIANHSVFLFYEGFDRYTDGLFMLSLIVFFWAFREMYWPLLIRRWPRFERYPT